MAGITMRVSKVDDTIPPIIGTAIRCITSEPVPLLHMIDRKSTRLNSSHVKISYAVFCLKKKNRTKLAARSFGTRDGPAASGPRGRGVRFAGVSAGRLRRGDGEGAARAGLASHRRAPRVR